MALVALSGLAGRSGLLLLVGGAVVLVAAVVPPMRAWMAPPDEHLRIVASNRSRWTWGNGLFAAGAIVTTVGLWLLAIVLQRQGSPVASATGLVLYLFGAAMWLSSLAVRLAVTVAAAEELARGGTVPGWFDPWQRWAGVAYGLHMFLGYLAFAAFGGGLLGADLIARWVGWATAVFGVLGAAGFLARLPRIPSIGPLFDPPLLLALPTLLVGIVLLVS